MEQFLTRLGTRQHFLISEHSLLCPQGIEGWTESSKVDLRNTRCAKVSESNSAVIIRNASCNLDCVCQVALGAEVCRCEEFREGDRVFARNREDQDWKSGTVTKEGKVPTDERCKFSIVQGDSKES